MNDPRLRHSIIRRYENIIAPRPSGGDAPTILREAPRWAWPLIILGVIVSLALFLLAHCINQNTAGVGRLGPQPQADPGEHGASHAMLSHTGLTPAKHKLETDSTAENANDQLIGSLGAHNPALSDPFTAGAAAPIAASPSTSRPRCDSYPCEDEQGRVILGPTGAWMWRAEWDKVQIWAERNRKNMSEYRQTKGGE